MYRDFICRVLIKNKQTKIVQDKTKQKKYKNLVLTLIRDKKKKKKTTKIITINRRLNVYSLINYCKTVPNF